MKIKDINEKYLKQEKKAKYEEYEKAAMECDEFKSDVAEAEDLLDSEDADKAEKAKATLEKIKEGIKKKYEEYSSKYEDEHDDDDDEEETVAEKKKKKKEDEDDVDEDEDDAGDDEETVAEKKKKKKEAIKESISNLFDGTQTLDEDFKERATVFLEDKIQKIYDDLEEEFQAKYDNSIEEEKKAVREKIQTAADTFMNEAVSEWVREKNDQLKIAAKATISESFIADLKKLLVSHDIMLEEETNKDIIEKYKKEAEDLEKKLEAEMEKRKKLQKELDGVVKESLIEKVGKDLTANEYDQLKESADEILYIDPESYAKKLKKLYESTFAPRQHRRKKLLEDRQRALTEDFDDEDDKEKQKTKSTNPSILAAKKILSGS